MNYSDSFYAALAYHQSGLNILPISADGKRCPLLKWKKYQYQTTPFVPHFLNKNCGIGIICGECSGNLEVIDFDDPTAWLPWITDPRLPDIIHWLPIIDTPRGGQHVYYRCPVIEGNQPLALYPLDLFPKGKARIETRGQGGFVVAPGGPDSVHPSGKPYKVSQGHLTKIPTITVQERAALLEVARGLTQANPPRVFDHKRLYKRKRGKQSQGLRPGDDYNARATWDDVLTPHGWRAIETNRAGVTYWTRPDSQSGEVHATTNYNGSDLLYVFSTSAGLPTEQGLSKFGVYAMLNHDGNFDSAAARLGEDGFGTAHVDTAEIEKLFKD